MNQHLQIPFGKDGNMLDGTYWTLRDATWIPNIEFDATLEFTDWHSARSSSQFHFRSVDGPFAGQVLILYSAELARVLRTQTVDKGKVTGRWTFYKRGSAFTLGLVK